MSGIFNADIFNNAIFNTGIGIAESTAGIGLAPRVVDYVYSAGWAPRISRLRAGQIGNVQKVAHKPEIRQDSAELKEMMDLYARWKKAA